MTRTGWVAVLVVVGGLWWAVTADAQQAGTAEVLLARAPVEVVPRGQTAARPLLKGARLSEGDRVRTGRGGAAEIRLGDGSLVRLGELSDLEIDKLDVDATGAPSTSRFNLATGQARAWVARQVVAKVSTGVGRFAVQTPTAVAAVRQTDFALLHDVQRPGAPAPEPGTSLVYTFAGEVQTSATEPGRAFVVCSRNRFTRVVPKRELTPCRVIGLREKRYLKSLAFESVSLEPGNIDLKILGALGVKLSDEKIAGGWAFTGGGPSTTHTDAPSNQATASVTVIVQ